MNRPASPSEPPPDDRGSAREKSPCCIKTRFLSEAVRGGEGDSSHLCRLLTWGVVTWGWRGMSQGWGAAVPVRWAKCCSKKVSAAW